MMKRSFFALSKPRLTYDLLEPDPEVPQIIPLPDLMTLLLTEAIDSTRPALIKKGDSVKKGQKLALYEDSTAYVISPVAGTIKSIHTYPDDFARIATSITIANDPKKISEIEPLELPEDISSAVLQLQKLPGAPPFDILADKNFQIRTIVITGADTDLLTTTSQYVSTTHARDLEQGASILKRLTGTARICLTLPEGLTGHTRFKSLKVLKTGSVYPDTLPAMIMKDHLDMVLPAGKTPEDMGICFIRAEAVVSLARTYEKKELVFEKHLTLVDKAGIRHRIKAVIGTPLRHIFSQLNIQINDQDRVIIGGPMRGSVTFTTHHPVTPDTDTVVIQDREILPKISDTPCVNCGKCIQICPASIQVNLLARFLEVDQYEEAADKYDLDACIECGLCTFVCTSQIALGQYIRLGKHELRKLRADV
jgi:Na+-translocating ferredoxin:NAD+ oxidoreductase subunit C